MYIDILIVKFSCNLIYNIYFNVFCRNNIEVLTKTCMNNNIILYCKLFVERCENFRSGGGFRYVGLGAEVLIGAITTSKQVSSICINHWQRRYVDILFILDTSMYKKSGKLVHFADILALKQKYTLMPNGNFTCAMSICVSRLVIIYNKQKLNYDSASDIYFLINHALSPNNLCVTPGNSRYLFVLSATLYICRLSNTIRF